MPYRAQRGGVFGSGLYGNQRPQVDVGGAIDAATRGASTLIQNAYQRTQAERQRRIADEDRKLQLEDRQRGIEREDREEARRAEELELKRATSGVTPAREETTFEVESGGVESGGLTGTSKVTAPSLRTSKRLIPAAYDPTNTPAYRLKQSERTREVDRLAAAIAADPVASKRYTTPAAQRAAAEAAADNAGLLDDLFRPDPRDVHRTNRDYDVRNPVPTRRAQGDDEGDDIRVAVGTLNAQMDDARAEANAVRAEIGRNFPDGAPDEYSTPEQKRQYGELQTRLNRLTASGDSLGTIRGAYAARQQQRVPVPRGSGAPTPRAGGADARPEITEDQLAWATSPENPNRVSRTEALTMYRVQGRVYRTPK